jgi:hypothetical protein
MQVISRRGTALLDEIGTQAADSYFGRVASNGGDWFELVVITDHLDMRTGSWIFMSPHWIKRSSLTIQYLVGPAAERLLLYPKTYPAISVTTHPQDDWWINVQANNTADGLYIEVTILRSTATTGRLHQKCRQRSIFGLGAKASSSRSQPVRK